MDDDVYAALAIQAADAGLSVPELLRREIVRVAARPPPDQSLERTKRRPPEAARREVLDALDEVRGRWPDADH